LTKNIFSTKPTEDGPKKFVKLWPNQTVTGINNTFWDSKFVGLFYRASPKSY